MRTGIAVFVGALIVVCIVFAAIPHLAAPDWTVTVVDLAGRPVRGERVREVYRDYSCDANDHEITKSTDKSGRVHFEPQYEHRNLFECLMYTISASGAGVHASFGRAGYVFAFGDRGEGAPIDARGNSETWTGSPQQLKSQIAIKY